jgi:TPR repeat protein
MSGMPSSTGKFRINGHLGRVILAIFLISLAVIPVKTQVQVDSKFKLDNVDHKRKALIIGNSNYQYINSLPNPRNDASDVQGALVALGFDTTLLIDAKHSDILQALDQFAGSSSDAEIVLFYYAGHAGQFNNDNYIFPTDAQLQKLHNEKELITVRGKAADIGIVSVTAVIQTLQNSGRVRVVVLDSCRDNPFTNTYSRSVFNSADDHIVKRGLARIGKIDVSGTLIAYAAQADKVAGDGTGSERNSPFTKAFLNHIGAPGVELRHIFSDIQDEVSKNSGHQQVPEFLSSMTGQFVLKPASNSYLSAAPQGGAVAHSNLGLVYETGFGVTKNDAEAASHYKLAAAGGIAVAQNNLANFYRDGRGGLPQNDVEAVRLYKLAAAQDEAVAQSNLGWMYENGRGVTKNAAEAARLYKLAADQDNAVAQNNLANLYRDGRGGLPQNDVEAVRLYKLAAAQGEAVAQISLAKFYLGGRGGLPQSDIEAVRFYKLAADQRNAVAQTYLATFYLEGRGGLPHSDIEAARLYELAAGQGLAVAQAYLATFYLEGRGGLPQSDIEAVRLYRLAADQRLALAQYDLGLMYENGRGVTKNDVEAARLYKLAADQGNALAQQALHRLLPTPPPQPAQ